MATPEPRPSGPLSRAEQQRATRQALVEAARHVFSRDGYHGANLSRIATEAGYSKGAVYSNFADKAELFLAVMDQDIDHVRGEAWDPLHPLEPRDHAQMHSTDSMRGFALATLEFVATAARSQELATALEERVQLLLDAYRRVVIEGGDPDDPLDGDQLATLLTALDQGVALLVVSGIASIDAALLRTGLRRLLQPAPSEEAGESGEAEHGRADPVADPDADTDDAATPLESLARFQEDLLRPPDDP